MLASDVRKYQIAMAITNILVSDDDSGWNLFLAVVDETSEIKDDPSAFKKVLGIMGREGVVAQTGDFLFPEGKKRVKHWGTAVWTGTPALEKWASELIAERAAKFDRVDGGSTDWEDWLGVAISGERQIPRGTYKTIIEKVKAGELTMLITRNDDASKKTGGSGR